MFRPDKQKDEHRFDMGWVIALIVIIFISFGVGPVSAGGIKVQSYNATKAAPAPTRRIDQGRIRRSTTRDVGGSRFSIDKSRLSKKKSKKKVAKKKAKKKIVKKAAKKPAKKNTAKKSGGKKKIKTLATHTIKTAKSDDTATNNQPYDEFNELGTTAFNVAPRLPTETLVTAVPGLTLAAWEKLNTIKENARAWETGLAGGAGLNGEEAFSILPSGERNNPTIVTPDGVKDFPGSSGTGQGTTIGETGQGGASGVLLGMIAGGKGASPSASDKFGGYVSINPSNDGTPPDTEDTDTTQTSTPAPDPTPPPPSNGDENGTEPGSYAEPELDLVIANAAQEVVEAIDSYVGIDGSADGTDAPGEFPSNAFEAVDTAFKFGWGVGRWIGRKLSGESDPGPCADGQGPGCNEYTTQDEEEADRRHRAIVAAINREHTGQPSPEEDAYAPIHPYIIMSTGAYRGGLRIEPGDCNSRVASCGENASLGNADTNGASVFQEIGWRINPGPH